MSTLPRLLVVPVLCLGACVTTAPAPEVPVAPPPAPAEPATHAAAAPPAAPEAAPERLGTPESSLKAAPAWWDTKEHGYAPQPDFTLSTWKHLRDAAPGDVEGAVLVCDVSTAWREPPLIGPKSWALPDLKVWMGVGPSVKAPRLQAISYGEEDHEETLAAASLVTLKVGMPLSVDVYDRDTFSLNLIDKLTATYQGTSPIELKAGQSEATCRVIARDEVEKREQEALGAADVELARTDVGLRVDLARPDLGRAVEARTSQYPLERAAAFAGWDDPRVQRRVQRLDGIQARFQRDLAQGLSARYAQLTPAPADLAGGSLHVEVRGLDCSAAEVKRLEKVLDNGLDRDALKQNGCVLALSVRNQGQEALRLQRANDLGQARSLQLLRLDGRRQPLAPAARKVAGKWVALASEDTLPPGAEVELALTALEQTKDREPLAGPLLLQGVHEPGSNRTETFFIRLPDAVR
jgi:hypothetical protein